VRAVVGESVRLPVGEVVGRRVDGVPLEGMPEVGVLVEGAEAVGRRVDGVPVGGVEGLFEGNREEGCRVCMSAGRPRSPMP
jgi:hypothetical protein